MSATRFQSVRLFWEPTKCRCLLLMDLSSQEYFTHSSCTLGHGVLHNGRAYRSISCVDLASIACHDTPVLWGIQGYYRPVCGRRYGTPGTNSRTWPHAYIRNTRLKGILHAIPLPHRRTVPTKRPRRGNTVAIRSIFRTPRCGRIRTSRYSANVRAHLVTLDIDKIRARRWSWSCGHRP